jgi:hypothetical protein
VIDFQEIEPECNATVNVTSLRYRQHNYTISTTEIISFQKTQLIYDKTAGYTGKTGNYETMLFVESESAIYPFGDLPGYLGLGVFQRYDTEDEARDGHQQFVTQVKQILRRN